MKNFLKIVFIIMVLFSINYAKDGMTQKEVLAYVDSLGLPDWYYEIKDIKEGKKAFIEYLLPIIKKENAKVEKDRLFIKEVFKKSYFEWSNIEVLKISKLAKKYKIKKKFNKDEFEKRVAQIPVSLVLAQAAVESGWGKSRFVKAANNVFGHWTFGKLGIAPKDRDVNKKHKLKLFKNISESVATYMLNLNRNWAYREFREERYLHIVAGKDYAGHIAAENMRRYSQIGMEYVEIIKSIIKENQLHIYDSQA